MWHADHLTLEQAAKLLLVSQHLIKKWIRHNQITYTQKVTQYLIPLKTVEDRLAKLNPATLSTEVFQVDKEIRLRNSKDIWHDKYALPTKSILPNKE